jgi:uncharacterized membrane protein
VTVTARYTRPSGLAVFLVVVGVIGFVAAFALTLDKFRMLENPAAQLSCNFSILVSCSTNLASWQGAIFGFPNPVIGLAAWSVVITVGLAVLAGARFSRWFWVGLNIGFLGAIVFVIWLIYQSIFVLGVLCPWCMVTWSVTIPSFLAVTFYTVKAGHISAPRAIRRGAGVGYSWLFVITIACYIVVAIVAQVNMDVLSRI